MCVVSNIILQLSDCSRGYWLEEEFPFFVRVTVVTNPCQQGLLVEGFLLHKGQVPCSSCTVNVSSQIV